MGWNAKQYLKFEAERTQPAIDLIARLDGLSPRRILDLGCGPGNSTALLARRFPKAALIGADASEDMLSRARKSCAGAEFRRCVFPEGLAELGSFDLIFSNACIHWIPGQEALLRALFASLNPGGFLAVQIPLTQRAPFYQALNELVKEEPWEKLREIRNFYAGTPEDYDAWLRPLAARQWLWETTYYHPVADEGAVLEWYRGSGLRPYEAMLEKEEKARLEEALLERLREAYPKRRGGGLLLSMARLFFLAQKAEESDGFSA
mgnify:CR=1 FL=1